MFKKLKTATLAAVIAGTLLSSGQAWALDATSGPNGSPALGTYGAATGCSSGSLVVTRDNEVLASRIDRIRFWLEDDFGTRSLLAGIYVRGSVPSHGMIPNNVELIFGGQAFSGTAATDLEARCPNLTDVSILSSTPPSTSVSPSNYASIDFVGMTFEATDTEDGNRYLYTAGFEGVTNTGPVWRRTLITPPDTTPPTVELSSSTSTLSGVTPFTVTATFNEDVTGFADADVTVTNGSIVRGSLSGGAAVYTFLVEPTGNGDVTIFVPENVAEDLAGNPNTASDLLVIGNRIVEITQEQIAGFMLGRANSLASNQPGLIRFLDGTSCGNFNANATAAAGSISGCVARDNFWAEVTSSWGGGNSYTLGTLGAHASINPNLIVGGMIQLDHATDDANNASGTGWMVGPYFAARMAEQPLFFEGRLLYGESSNSITPLGTYTDSFSTERWLAQLKVQGEIVAERVTWSPSLALTHTTDSQRAYTDSLGNTIPGQSIGLTQVNSGIDFRMPLDVAAGDLQLSGGLAAIYSATHGGNADFEGGRGRINMGLDWNSGNGSTLRFGTFYDGIGSKHESYGANLGLDIRF